MSRLVTGLFYNRQEAESAVQTLRDAGVPTSDIYLEQEVEPTAEIGRKGAEVSRLEKERRFAGLESGVIIGLSIGLLAGMGIGMFGQGIAAPMRTINDPSINAMLPPVLTNPVMSALLGALLGAVVGAIIGRIIDMTLDRLGAGPARPMEETLVTIRASEDRLDDVYATLFRARARHLHVSEQAL